VSDCLNKYGKCINILYYQVNHNHLFAKSPNFIKYILAKNYHCLDVGEYC